MGMRVWFDGGKLKVYIGTENTFERRKLLSETYSIRKEFVRGEYCTMVVLDDAKYVDFIRKAEKWGAEVSDEAKLYVLDYERRRHEAFERAQEEERQKTVVQRAEILMRKGCGWCPDLDRQNGRCKYANAPVKYRSEEVERALEDWKEARVTGERRFYAKAYPCQGCKTIVEANKILEAKEKEDGKQANL